MTTQSSHFAQARARQALRSAGLPFDGKLVAASSTRNEVFLSEKYVVRINRQPNQRLRREALLYRFLPQEPWAPIEVHHGGEVGADYLIVQRRPGQPLSRAWPTLSPETRRSAIAQLSAVLAELHSTPTRPDLPRLELATHLIDPRCVSPVVPLLVAIDELSVNPMIDRGLMGDLEQIVVNSASALDDYNQRTLIHGDLTFENILWDGDKITALVDFEWCRGASSDMDLDVFLRFCAFPQAHVAEDYEAQTKASDYADVPGWLAEDRPDLFAHDRLSDRLRLYCLAFDVRDLSESIPNARTKLGPLHPMNRLRSLASGTGHIDSLLYRLGIKI